MSSASNTANPGNASASTAGGQLRQAFAGIYPAIVLSVVVLVIWELVSRIFKLPQFVLPSPSAIGRCC